MVEALNLFALEKLAKEKCQKRLGAIMPAARETRSHSASVFSPGMAGWVVDHSFLSYRH